MSRTSVAIWLVGIAACLLNLCFSCPVLGQEIARVPVAAGVVTVERDGDMLRVAIASGDVTTIIEIPAEGGAFPPAGPDPEPPADDPVARAVDKAVESIPPEFRPVVLGQIVAELDHAIGIPDRLNSTDDAVRLVTSRAIFALPDIGSTFAGTIAAIAGTLYENDDRPIAERLSHLKAVLEGRL